MSTRFTHLTLENWRNFRKADVDLAERAFIVGPNAAGKTNLIDAFRFLREVAQPEGSLVRAVKERGGMAHLRSLHARQESDVRIEVTLMVHEDTWEYELVLSGTKKSALQIVRERVVKNGDQLLARPQVKLIRSLEETRVVPASSESQSVEAARARVPLGKLVTGRTRPSGIEQLSFEALTPTRR